MKSSTKGGNIIALRSGPGPSSWFVQAPGKFCRKINRMRALKPWVEALKLNPNQVAQWTLDVPKHESVTFWCLDRGLIRAADYFEWAKEFYQLPCLDSEYFQNPANRELWMKIQSVANWNAELLPLEEWDGVVFVGCVEPPENIQWSFPVAYVLVNARDLKLHWERLQSEPTKVSMPAINLKNLSTPKPPTQATEPASPKVAAKLPPKPVAEVQETPPVKTPPPSAPAPAAGNTLKLNLNFGSPAQNQTPMTQTQEMPVESSEPPTPVRESSVSIPGGLNLNISDIKLGGSDSSSDAPEGLSLNLTQPDSSAPEGLAIPADHNVFEQDEVPTGVFSNPDFNIDTEPPILEEVAEAQPKLHPKPTGAPIIPPAPTGSTDDPEDMPDRSVTSFTMVAPPPGAASSENGMIDSDREAPRTIESAQNQRESVAWVLQQLRQYFHFSWLFFLKGDKLTPQFWEKSARKVDDAATDAIDLTQPSLFRIVARTRMPYHGHIVDNPINTGFFKKWGLRSTPEHVTAIPVLNGDKLVAVLLAAGKKPEKSDAVLRFVERLAPSISVAITKPKKAA